MRSICVVVSALLASSVVAGGAVAQTSASYSPASTQGDLLPSALEVYSSSEALTTNAFGEVSTVVSTGRPQSLARPSALAFATEPSDGDEGGGGGSKYLPVLFSTLMPGTGELYLGYTWRGAGLMALEVAAWAGYFYYRDQGLDSREAYESFADTYWSTDKWISDHPVVWPEQLSTPEQMDSVGAIWSGTGSWPGYMPWVSREEDKQHFYENVGKYDWFISGWSDFDIMQDPFMRNTDLRDQYRAMRKESNDQLETADKFIYLSLATRVFSIVETLFLVRSADRDDAGEESTSMSENRLRLRARPRGFDGGEISLEYSFK